MRLAPETLDRLAGDVAVPAYKRRVQEAGIVHFGVGAFARAHLADYTDKTMAAGERGWMIDGVSLRSAGVAEQLNPQSGLYTVTEQGAKRSKTRVIGAVREVMVAGRDDGRIIDAIAAPPCKIASFTVTEKGYCRAADGSLDRVLASEGFYPLLADGLARREMAGLPGLTLLSCDNLPHNGRILGQLVAEWLDREKPELAAWFTETCRTPATMVDRIVPATTADDLTELTASIGLRDEGAVFTEPFSQWVIEDDFAGVRPRWENCGARIVRDVGPFETAKLRMLNGAHSLLAYAGLARGHAFVHEAVADPWIASLVERLMREEAAPTIVTAEGQDLDAYASDLLARFANPALRHRLTQIAMDGSQKIPQRWLGTLADADEGCSAILTGIAAWLIYLERCNDLDDPWADRLRAITGLREDIAARMQAVFGHEGLLRSDWTPGPEDAAFVGSKVAELT